MANTVLLTGEPKIGKTTCVCGYVDKYPGCGGLISGEIRAGGRRVGFGMRSLLDDSEAVLAHVDSTSDIRVDKYGVNLGALDDFATAALRRALISPEVHTIVVDEIGPMQACSEVFREVVEAVLASPKRVLGTIALGSHPWIDQIKGFRDIKFVKVTTDNRNDIPCDIESFFSRE